MILVIAEHRDGTLNRATLETIAAAQAGGGPIKVAVLGSGVDAVANELAAADVARGLSPGVPCDVAARVAADNGAQLSECAVVAPENTIVDVTAVIELPQPLASLGPATGVSRAGPPPGEP